MLIVPINTILNITSLAGTYGMSECCVYHQTIGCGLLYQINR